MSTQTAAPGWYENGERERFWNGESWTDDYRPLATSSGPQPVALSADSPARFEYKVLTQKDRFFAGKFDPQRLESAINSYAAEGWLVTGVATADIGSGFGSGRQELIVVLQRSR